MKKTGKKMKKKEKKQENSGKYDEIILRISKKKV